LNWADWGPQTWEKSDLAKTIIMKGAGEKAFCAGGDVAGIWMRFARLIVALVTIDASGTILHEARKNYFRHEYTLDYYLSTYDKPMIAIMDGITSMHQVICANLSVGGGVGLSINCPFRVAKDHLRYARNINWILS
jgi:3-hydroxyisobutyryl-CoA hydrolase